MEVPKRKIKEEKPKKRLGKKEVLIVPIIMGGATLVALLLTQIVPPPNPTEVCLKSHNVETFQLYPRVEVIVDGQLMNSSAVVDAIQTLVRERKIKVKEVATSVSGTAVIIKKIKLVSALYQMTKADPN